MKNTFYINFLKLLLSFYSALFSQQLLNDELRFFAGIIFHSKDINLCSSKTYSLGSFSSLFTDTGLW